MIRLDSSISSILIKGLPGTGKSTLALELLKEASSGTYIATRISKELLALQNPQIKMVVANGNEVEYSMAGRGLNAIDLRLANSSKIVKVVIEALGGSQGNLVVIDSWDAIGKELNRVERLKTEKTMVSIAQSGESKLCFVSERPGLSTIDYLVDLVVELQTEIHNGRVRRHLQTMKSRGQEIREPFSLYSLAGGKFTEAPKLDLMFPGQYDSKPIEPSKGTKTTFGTGIEEADSFPGGSAPRGSTMLLEKFPEVPATALLPLTQLFQANFIVTGGSFMVVPAVGAPPELVLDPLRKLVSPEAVNKSVRVGLYQRDSDPCCLELNPESLDETFARIWKAVDELKGPNQRPCYIDLDIAKMEYVHGKNGLVKHVIQLIERVRYDRDFATLMVNDSTELKSQIASIVDSHVLFEMEANTLTAQSLRPSSPIVAIGYQYSKGYPSMNILPLK